MKSKIFLSLALGFAVMLSGCSGGSTPLKELAETYAEIADNNQKMIDSFQAIYKADRNQQGVLPQKAQSVAESVKPQNERLAEKAKSLGKKLQDTQIKCEASAALGVTVTSAKFTTVNAHDKLANIVITVEIEGTPDETPYFFLMDEKDVLYKSAARFSNGKISVNFRITTNKGSDLARTISKTQKLMLVTQSEYNAGGVSNQVASSESQETAEPEPAYERIDDSKSVDSATAEGVKIENGANIVSVLKASKSVTYEYNADSGIWAHIGNVSIIIDEDQLNQKGTDFMSTIYSDIEPNLQFSPDYVKPDAKILNIEKN